MSALPPSAEMVRAWAQVHCTFCGKCPESLCAALIQEIGLVARLTRYPLS